MWMRRKFFFVEKDIGGWISEIGIIPALEICHLKSKKK